MRIIPAIDLGALVSTWNKSDYNRETVYEADP